MRNIEIYQRQIKDEHTCWRALETSGNLQSGAGFMEVRKQWICMMLCRKGEKTSL
jgi:hypothetical protein